MSRTYKIFRALLMTIIVVVVMVPTALYIVLSTDWAQERIRVIAEDELSRVLGTEVNIGHVRVTPFNRLVLNNVTVADDYGLKALDVRNIDTRFEFWNFVTTFRLSFDYAELDGVRCELYRLTPDSPLNIAGILENLKPKEEKKEPAKFDLSVFTVRINSGSFTYDVLDQPRRAEGFDKNHISLSDVTLMATAPKLSDSRIEVLLRKMSFVEQAGLRLRNFTANVVYTQNELKVDDIVLELPATRLDLGNYHFRFDNSERLKDLFKIDPVDVHIGDGSYLTLSDLGWIVPAFVKEDRSFDIALDATLSLARADVRKLSVVESDGETFLLKAIVNAENYTVPDSMQIDVKEFDLTASAVAVKNLLSHVNRPLSQKVTGLIEKLGDVRLTAYGTGTLNDVEAVASLTTDIGAVKIDAAVSMSPDKSIISAESDIEVNDFDLGYLLDKPDFGKISADLGGAITIEKGRQPYGDISLVDGSVVFRDDNIHDIELEGNLKRDGHFEAHFAASGESGRVNATVAGNSLGERPSLSGNVEVADFNPYALRLTNRYPGYKLGVNIDFDLAGKLSEWIDGYVDITDFTFDDGSGDGLNIKRLNLKANNTERPHIILLESDFLNGSLQGDLSIAALVPDTRDILSRIIPSVITPSVVTERTGRDNNFNFSFELANAQQLLNFFKVPVEIIYPVTIEGKMDYGSRSLVASVDAPYLMKGDMMIEGTLAQFIVDGAKDKATGYVTTQFPTKKGEMVIMGGLTASDNVINAELDWNIERTKPVGGKLAFDVCLERMEDNTLSTSVKFQPCEIQFGEDTWQFSPSVITYHPGYLSVDNFSLAAGKQRIHINGITESDNPDSEILVDLDNIVLLSIFETLDINKALIGGTATGTFHAKGLFGPELALSCPALHVDSIGYNRCVLGNADLTAKWDNGKKSFSLDADITGFDDRHSHIWGDITPATESLDIHFEANRAKVGFMKPFIDAFASDITGYASGYAHLFGTFKYIDLEGDILAEDLGIKIDFTNTWYYTTDSIHLRPGVIDIKNVKIKDAYGNTADLNGYVKHAFFKDPVFDFRVTNAHNFLSYDVTPKQSPDWYGRIFGNGSAYITGSPGVVNIDVNMSTAPDSKFYFVISDYLEAEQYNFITFRDRNRGVITDSIIEVDDMPAEVREYRDRKRAEALAQNPPAAYNMNFQVDITPDAQVILVMDPVGGDEINSRGQGSLRMTYASQGNDLRMFGTYTIDRGTYNFTLQDVIVKDFIINEGSSISFTGDPYSARLNIKAVYSVNANLSDLDESFLQDKELNRTNVPVHAVLLVTGDMRQPDIDFDLEFPTLSSDIYRKVRSIVSTDEMMNRQIIYLLALNRFYTPEYMSATRGNELFSVASSTISSRLSSMLGKLSENWTIAPNLRSDRGDFSDVEFDLALSSSLLNNRLRLNGNFGYRDKSLNTNQFIGDFDLEYLLNKSGTWRLKAYNRYNDQNYYLRTAQTTQGIGVMFRRDFDDWLGFLSRRKKNKDEKDSKDNTETVESDENKAVKPESETDIEVTEDKPSEPTE